MKPRIKICCISSIDEACTAISFGASALGLVGNMPSGPGVISDELIWEIAQAVPPPIGTFLLTSETAAADIIAHHHRTRTNTIQIVDELTEGSYQELRAALPGIKLVQVIHVIDAASVTEAVRIAAQVDALLLDSGNPKLAVKELGGTGQQAKVPVFLAGGLNVNNVKAALDVVQPFGLDLCSSVRTENKLDPHKLEAFFTAALA
jgi:phosphoribosylanthranilate isomerase